MITVEDLIKNSDLDNESLIITDPQNDSLDIAEALITIQKDLFDSESVIELGEKYVAYQDILKQLFLKALDKLCK